MNAASSDSSAPPGLAELQRRFAQSLRPDITTTELDEAYHGIGGAANVHPQARLAVYRNNAIGVQILALQTIYPACLRILGEACFRTLGRDYLQAHPSTDPDLNRFGNRYPELLSGLQDGVGEHNSFADYPYLADLARLEWALHQAWFAADSSPFDPAQLSDPNCDPPQLRFALPPGTRLLASRWPLLSLHRSGDPHPADGDGPLPLCIYRQGYAVVAIAVEHPLFALLGGIQQQRPLGELAAAGLAIERIGELLQRGCLTQARP